ncbi:MAG: hypothetical protein PWR13_486 [Archaeoglobi archaeon]|nr:hypothetical protein [Archaeoglobi archaeon]MDK2781458.1 hypothetical protein [Archaeoglobi archaeon]
MRRESELWFKTAEEDLKDARAFIEMGRYFRTAFFAQQAVEKVLKALFIGTSENRTSKNSKRN